MAFVGKRVPTDEQQAVIDAAVAGEHLAVQAGAGTGKTSTLEMLAKEVPVETLYIAFNKSTQTDAEKRFPIHVQARTAHSLAYREVGKNYRNRMNTGRQPASMVAELLKTPWINIPGVQRPVSPYHSARIMLDTVRQFCYSADDEIGNRHVPWQTGLLPSQQNQVIEAVLPFAQRAWADLQDPDDGILRFEHDHYLKMWALTRPQLPAEVIMLDEAQDSNPVLVDVVRRQQGQKIIVGDGCQQLYAWRGAVDALGAFPEARTLYLSQSWRFGPAIAEQANIWLSALDTPLRLTGAPNQKSSVGPLSDAHAILCRTNGGAMREVLDALKANRTVALVGGTTAMHSLITALGKLRAGAPASHPELYLFATWDDLREYVDEDTSGGDLKPLVDMVDNYGAPAILKALDALSAEESAEVVVSTAHKAKGREWPTVRIATDFFTPADWVTALTELPRQESMLHYVAVTRARQQLDPVGLEWVNALMALGTEVQPEEDAVPDSSVGMSIQELTQ